MPPQAHIWSQEGRYAINQGVSGTVQSWVSQDTAYTCYHTNIPTGSSQFIAKPMATLYAIKVWRRMNNACFQHT